jgi:co-chaperonin GroES (HSP10)
VLQPLGHRVLVKPDAQPDESAGGLVLPEDRDHVPVSGQIVALGPGGSLVRFKARQRGLQAALKLLEPITDDDTIGPAREEIQALLNTPDPERDLKVGDYVVFPAEVGHIVEHDGEQFILVNEDDVVALEVA